MDLETGRPLQSPGDAGATRALPRTGQRFYRGADGQLRESAHARMAARLAQVVLGKQKLGAAAVRRCEVKRRAAAGAPASQGPTAALRRRRAQQRAETPTARGFLLRRKESASATQVRARERTCFRADAAHANDQRGCMRQAARAVAT